MDLIRTLKLASICGAISLLNATGPAATAMPLPQTESSQHNHQPQNSLRSSASDIEHELCNVFATDNTPKVGFKIQTGVLSDSVLTDQQLADFAYGYDIAEIAETDNPDIMFDPAVQPAAFEELTTAGGGFSIFSGVKIASFEETPKPKPDSKTDISAALGEPADVAHVELTSPATGAALAPTAPQGPAFGPALPADFSFDLPVSQQMIGDLLEEIQRQKDSLPKATEDGDEELARRQRMLDESHNALLQAKKFLKKDFLQRNSIKTFEADKQILQEKLAVDRTAKLPVGEESAEDLFSALDGFRREMEEVNSRLYEVSKTELQHKVRLGEIPKDRAAARKQISEIKKQLKNEEIGNADTFVMIRLRAEELEQEYRIESLDSESKLYELENRLLPMNDDLLAREIKILESEIETWNRAANQRRRQDLEAEAQLARDQVLEAAPSLQELAQLNVALTERRIKFTEQIRTATEEEIKVKESLNSVKSQHENVEKSIIDNTLSQANGLLLVDIRRKMVRPFESHQRIRHINRELQQISLDRLLLNEKREGLSHPVEYAKDMLQDVHSPSISDSELLTMAVEIIESIRQQYDLLSADHHTYIDLLGKIVAEREELVSEIKATMEFVNQKSLWVQSAQPISVAQVAKSRYGLSKFFSPLEWTNLMGELTNRFVTRPHESAAGLIGLIALFTFSRRFKVQE